MGSEQYLQDRKIQVQQNLKNQKLAHAVNQFTPHLVRSNYVKNFTWMGIPIIQYPTDMMLIQELICEIRPLIIIETGLAFGGSALFYRSILDLIGCKDSLVISIDVDPRPENIDRLPDDDQIFIWKGSSIEQDLLTELEELDTEGEKNLIVLDSNHTHDHVLAELRAYSKFVSVGSYFVVMDTAIEFYGHLDKNQDRPWGKGNNPWTAVQQFMKEQDDFIIDKEVEQRALITGAIDGWLKRIK